MTASGFLASNTIAGRMTKITLYTMFVLALQAHLIPWLP